MAGPSKGSAHSSRPDYRRATEEAQARRWTFWTPLARRATGVLSRSSDNTIRFLWIDDILEPASALQEGEKSSATALAHVSEDSGTSHVRYNVTLLFNGAAADAYRIGDLERLLPEADATDWLVIDRANKQLTINLAA
jgi:hypothetical protein